MKSKLFQKQNISLTEGFHNSKTENKNFSGIKKMALMLGLTATMTVVIISAVMMLFYKEKPKQFAGAQVAKVSVQTDSMHSLNDTTINNIDSFPDFIFSAEVGQQTVAGTPDAEAIVSYSMPERRNKSTYSGKSYKTQMGSRSINGSNGKKLIESKSNVSNGICFRGSRAEGTAYYIDGVRTINGVCRTISKRPGWFYFVSHPRSYFRMKNYERRMAKQYRESQTQVAVAETPVPSVTIIPVKEPEVIVEPVQEEYAYLIENEYLDPFAKPLSTFSIDVDNASYTNTRRILNEGRLPDYDAVRIEEFINYFDYQYLKPTDKKPFAVDLETAECPWNKETKLVRIGLQGEVIKKEIMPPTNLVFLVDVSGSMQEENKLPLVKQSLKVLIENMRPSDHIAIVSYAAAAGLVLASTSCSEKEIINKAIDNMNAGGSTAGGEGLILAYNIAAVNAEPKSNNRIILVTDGDFNVGLQSDEEMQKLIEKKRNTGIFLTVCGFGMGNYKDSKMEILADKGNGNYYYIDNYKEAIKLFSTNLTGTLFTIAKDVKIQVEFNPAFVKAYRLIGYENRKLKDEDFEDDTKDAGELGSGHNVTALYEIIPAGSTMKVPGFTELKYQENTTPKTTVVASAELLTIKLRYKTPYKDTSTLIVKTMMPGNKKFANASESFRYAAGVTAFAMVLRNSKYKGCATYKMAKEIINSSDLNTSNGYKTELVQLIDKAALLSIPK